MIRVMKQTSIYRFTYLIIFISVFFSSSLLAKQAILAIHSYHQEHIWTGFLKQGIDDVLANNDNVIVYHEYLDAKRYPQLSHHHQFFTYLEKKYVNTPLNVVMVSDDAALLFLTEKSASFISNLPVVYSGINKVSEELLNKKNHTGVFENRDIATTIFDIKRLTKTNALIVISDSSIAGKTNLAKALAVKDDARSPQRIHIFNDLIPAELTTKIKVLGDNMPILKVGQLVNVNKNNALFSWNKGTEILTRELSNPVFTLSSTTLEYGAVGFDELNGVQHGVQAAYLAKRILDGENVNNISPITNANSVWTFNWQQLKKYQFNEEDLPADSNVKFRDENFYEQNKLLVWLTASAFFIALLVIVLLSEIIVRGREKRLLLAENETRYKDLAHSGASIFWETNSFFIITYISGNTQELWNKSPEQLIGMPFIELFQGTSIEIPLLKLEQAFSQKKPIDHVLFKQKIANDKAKVFILNGKVITSNNGFIGYRGICNDVSQEQHLSEKLTFQATYDALTGLVNRETFNGQLTNFVVQSNIVETSSYLCFLDLDRFKLVNDTAGHLVGDAMLAHIANELKKCISNTDVLGRLGGDEFGLLLVNKSHQEALAICEKIITVINQVKFNWRTRYFSVGISMGMVSIIPGLSATELLSKADIACYKAKELGKNRVFSTKADSEELQQNEQEMAYIANVSHAIEQNQFFLVKQPICPSKVDLSYHHYEVLLRYRDDNGNLISPAFFIPAAEKFGVITLIDEWVVTTVFDNFTQYFADNSCVSINLSGLSLSNESFIERIITLLEQSNVNPERICFEITETAAISNMACALSFMAKMKALGIRFALDDFGSGASSFGYLKSLPVDYLKIDGSLVKNMLTEPVDSAIIESIHEIAQMLGMKTIAEFVENSDIRLALADIGVDFVQGYGIGKPEPC